MSRRISTEGESKCSLGSQGNDRERTPAVKLKACLFLPPEDSESLFELFQKLASRNLDLQAHEEATDASLSNAALWVRLIDIHQNSLATGGGRLCCFTSAVLTIFSVPALGACREFDGSTQRLRLPIRARVPTTCSYETHLEKLSSESMALPSRPP
jgi:hypothetical protein